MQLPGSLSNFFSPIWHPKFPYITPGCLWAVGCLSHPRTGSGQTFLYLAQHHHRLPPKSSSGGGWVNCYSLEGCTQIWSLVPLKTPPLRFWEGIENLLTIHSWLPRGPSLGIAKDADGRTPWNSGRSWRLRSTRGFMSTQASDHNFSDLQRPRVYKRCMLITSGRAIASCHMKYMKKSCLPISCMFPVLTRSGSLAPYFPYTAYVKLRTKNQDGLVLFCSLLLSTQREPASSEILRSFTLLPWEPGWAPLSFGEYPREHNWYQEVCYPHQSRLSGQGMCSCVPGKNLQCYELPPKKLSILVYLLLKLTNYLHSWNGLFGF